MILSNCSLIRYQVLRGGISKHHLLAYFHIGHANIIQVQNSIRHTARMNALHGPCRRNQKQELTQNALYAPVYPKYRQAPQKIYKSKRDEMVRNIEANEPEAGRQRRLPFGVFLQIELRGQVRILCERYQM